MVAASRTTSQANRAPTRAITRVTRKLASKTLASSHPAPKPTSISTVRIDHPPARPSTRPMMIIVRPLTAVSLVRATPRGTSLRPVWRTGPPGPPPVGGEPVVRPAATASRQSSGWVGRMPSLTRAEATARAALITVDAMAVDLDLDRGAEVFGSRTTIRFTCRRPRGIDLRRPAGRAPCTR